jgi:hypothetical protein
LVWLVAVLAPGAALAQSGTNYLNVVGYVNLDLPAGYSLIADPLLDVANDLNSVLSNTPEGSVFYEFDNASSQYEAATNFGGVWSPVDNALVPGGGGLLFLPAETVVTFVGEIHQGDIDRHIPAGFSILSVPIPGVFNLTNSLFHFPVEQGETIYRYDNDAGQFMVSTYANGQFNPPGIAMPNVGEAFFVLRGTAVDWTFNFVVNAHKPRRPGTRPVGLQKVDGAVQQGTVNFCNVAGLLDQPILDANNGQPLDPGGMGQFLAELLAGPDESHLEPVPSSIAQVVNGRFFGGSVTLPPPLAASGSAFAQVVAWDGSESTNYLTAMSLGAAFGQSPVFTTVLTTGAVPLPPATLANFTSFAVAGSATPPGPLSMTMSGSNVFLRWPAAPPVLLEKASSLSNPNWQPVAGTLGAGLAIEAPATNGAFYRLVLSGY